VIAHLYDQELAERAQQQLHITTCQSVSALATPAFVAAALDEGVLSTIDRGRLLWLLAETRVEAGSEAEGMTIEAVETAAELRVVAVRDESGERWRPHTPPRLRAGHDVLVACSRQGWDRLRRLTTTAAAAIPD
jgi:hypothetical protein